MPTLLDELKALVEKYGYDPKAGGLEPIACWNCNTTEKGLPKGERLILQEDSLIEGKPVVFECSMCSRKFASE
jgi:hypothetical protein